MSRSWIVVHTDALGNFFASRFAHDDPHAAWPAVHEANPDHSMVVTLSDHGGDTHTHMVPSPSGGPDYAAALPVATITASV